MKKILITLTLIASLFSCSESEYLNEGSYYYLDFKGSDFPIWITGNRASDVVLITVHGGPGDSGMGFAVSPGFQMIEEDYTVVYWDQRFSGMTQGHEDRSLLNPEQFIEDTEVIVDFIKTLLPGKTYFMLGHSWGGQLSAGFLGRNGNADQFNGWIDLDGSIKGTLESQLMKEWILERVPAKLADPESDKEYWQFIIDYYEENPQPGNYSEVIPYSYVSSLEGDAFDWEKTAQEYPVPYSQLIFKSMFSLSYYVYGFGEKKDMIKWDNLDFTPELENISIPVLLLWGAEDGVVPSGVADYVYEHLATDPSQKQIVKIPECGHGPQSEKPVEFYNNIRDFIETNK